jgi:hypothetical protein
MPALLLAWCCLACAALPAAALEGWSDRTIDGRLVHFDAGCSASGEPELERAFASVLADQIAKLGRLPDSARALIAPVEIFVSSGTHRAFGAQHHPSAAWLASHGYPAAFARNVEICNWREFTTLVKDQPFCLLHEMAHAYQDRRPDIDAAIHAAFTHAQSSGLYLKVSHLHGTELVQAYALSNDHEYFAELSEAYFGENDFFPYDRAELRLYDPDGFSMIELVWGIR